MAKENGSYPPKERINIRYEPKTGDAKEEKELPLKLIMLGDYSLKHHQVSLEHEDRKPIPINKNNFDEIMGKQGLSLEFSVPNRLSGEEDDDMIVKLSVSTLKDLEPDSVVEKIPQLKKLLEMRRSLSALKTHLDIGDFRRSIENLLNNEVVREQLINQLTIMET